MSMERKPVAFGDMRNWMKALKSAGEMREIDAEVDWNVELGTVTRMACPGVGEATRRSPGATGPYSASTLQRTVPVSAIGACAPAATAPVTFATMPTTPGSEAVVPRRSAPSRVRSSTTMSPASTLSDTG